MSFPNLPPALSDLLDSGLTTLTLRRLAEREREVAAELLRQQRDQERVCVILERGPVRVAGGADRLSGLSRA